MADEKETGGPAFPFHEKNGDGTHYHDHPGMTLRDFFAAKAMQGLLANPGGPIQANGMSGWSWCNCTVESVADFAGHIADAMLAEREEPRRPSMTDQTMTHLTKMISEYIDDYHLEGDEGSYTPTRRERFIAEEIIISMLVDDEMADVIRAALSRPALQQKPALEWSRTLLDGELVTYKQAEKAVAELGDGWRLPTRKELESLLDLSRHDPAIDVEKYPDTESYAYWTSTPCAWNPDAVRWVVGFGDGSVYYHRRSNGACVRAVRAVLIEEADQ